MWGLKPLALAAVIALAMVACLSPDDTGGEGPGFVAVTRITGLPSYKQTNNDLPLSGTVLPSDATNKTIAWSIADAGTTGAAVVNGVLKTTSAGTAAVTATVVNGASKTADYTQNFTINVVDVIPDFIPVSDITGVPTTTTAGADLVLTGLVEPSDATNKTIVWSIAAANSLNGATVVNGVLKTTSAGTAAVTATIANGAGKTADYTQNFTITVTSAAPPGGNVPGTPASPRPFNNITAAQLAAQIKIGWNLGNTLDAHNLTWLGANPTVTQMEEGWSNPATTKAMIDAIKNAGFNAIRIPVSWKKAADSNYNIRADWMERVVQIVNYAVDNDMYIILNTHHDEEIFKFTNAEKAASLAAFKKIWEQIAVTFRNYNEKLIFEGLNEPRTIGSGAEWGGGTEDEHAVLNAYYPVFVQAVRASGGNNDKRFLIINPYAASATQLAVNALVLPADTAANKLIVSIHAYTPYEFCYIPDNASASRTSWSSAEPADTGPIHNAIEPAYNKFVNNGIPVIIGEFGAVNKNNNTAARTAWAQYYAAYAKGRGIPCFIWDNGSDGSQEGEDFGLFNRSNNNFYFTEIKDALIYGAEHPISSGGVPIPPNIAGNMGNYSFGKQEDDVTPNYDQAVWTLTGTNLTTAKQPNAQLVLALNAAPTASMQLVWQGPANNLWWNDKPILDDNGNPISGTGVTWNAGAKTLTINLATALKDYSIFTAQPSLNLIIAYYSGGGINGLGMVSANLTP